MKVISKTQAKSYKWETVCYWQNTIHTKETNRFTVFHCWNRKTKHSLPAVKVSCAVTTSFISSGGELCYNFYVKSSASKLCYDFYLKSTANQLVFDFSSQAGELCSDIKFHQQLLLSCAMTFTLKAVLMSWTGELCCDINHQQCCWSVLRHQASSAVLLSYAVTSSLISSASELCCDLHHQQCW